MSNASEIHQLFADAFNRGDADAVANLYEAEAVLIVEGETVIGREAIRDAYRDIVARHGKMTLRTLSMLESKAGIALLRGEWSHLFKGEPAGSTMTTRGVSTEVVRRQSDGNWLFLIDDPSLMSHRATVKVP